MSAPRERGCCKYGVRKVLSTIKRAPIERAYSAVRAMSVTFIRGFPGVSTKMIFVFAFFAALMFDSSEVSV